jgi:hypothetical protein
MYRYLNIGKTNPLIFLSKTFQADFHFFAFVILSTKKGVKSVVKKASTVFYWLKNRVTETADNFTDNRLSKTGQKKNGILTDTWMLRYDRLKKCISRQ